MGFAEFRSVPLAVAAISYDLSSELVTGKGVISGYVCPIFSGDPCLTSQL